METYGDCSFCGGEVLEQRVQNKSFFDRINGINRIKAEYRSQNTGVRMGFSLLNSGS